MMEIKDWITFAGLIIGPISAVCITLWYTRRTERRGSKERLFITLMIHRRANPIPADWVNGLNLIDVTFAGNRAVIDKWHEFYRELNRPKDQINWTQVGHLKLELLSRKSWLPRSGDPARPCHKPTLTDSAQIPRAINWIKTVPGR